MTLGELADKLKELAEADADVERAMEEINHGGSPRTLQGKWEHFEVMKRWRDSIREEELEL